MSAKESTKKVISRFLLTTKMVIIGQIQLEKFQQNQERYLKIIISVCFNHLANESTKNQRLTTNNFLTFYSIFFGNSNLFSLPASN